jgi:probable HAF family extracellular repeat protein
MPAGIPKITTAPTGGTRSAGVNSTLTVSATGTAPLTYQWLRGTATSPTAEIPGATSASFTLSSPSAADTAYYSVRISNALGSLTSEPVLVAYESSAGGLARTDLPTSYTASNSAVNAVIPFADDSFVIGGTFTSVSSVAMSGLARFAADGALDDGTFPQITAGSGVTAMVRDSSGRILLGGSAITEMTDGDPWFIPYTRYGLARILANGRVDAGFNSPVSSASSAFTNAIAVESSGAVLIGGTFSNVIGQPGTKYLLRLNGTTGAADATFTPTLPSAVNAIHLLADGKILVGHGTGMAMLNSDGTPAAGFSYGGGTPSVQAIQPLPDGDFLIGRNGTTHPLIRITSTGSLVTPFPSSGTGANNSVTEILALPSGNFILGGLFTTYNGSTVNRIAHITADGTAAAGFTFGTGFNNAVHCLALDANNNLWVGGSFTTYRSQDRRKLACLSTTSTPAADPGAPAPDAYTQFLIDAGIPADRRGTADDPDGDGSINLHEFENATNPTDPASAAFRLSTTGLGATITADPTATGGLYAPNTQVSLSVTPDPGNVFLGWAPSGESPAVTNLPLVVLMNQNRTFTAYAGLPLTESLDAPALSWNTGGEVLWRGTASPSHDGTDSVIANGLTAAGQQAWLETTVDGPGVLALHWTLNTAVANAATLQVLANGSPLQTLASTTGGYQSYAVNRTTTGPTTLRIRLTGNAGISATDGASIDQFYYGPFLSPTLLPPSDLSSTSATIHWTAVPGATSYLIQVASNPTFTANAQSFFISSSATSQPVSSLVAGTTYHVRVTAYGPTGVTNTQSTGTFTPADRLPQTLDFPQPVAMTVGDPVQTLTATATSGLSVSYQIVSGPGSVNGNLLTATGAGEIIVRATQAGDTLYQAAPPVDRSVTVAQGSQTITFAALPNYEANPLAWHSLNASASSGLPVTFTVQSGPAAIFDGMLQVTGIGLVRIIATQAGNADYLAATPVIREFTAVAAEPAARMKITRLGKLPGSTLTPAALAISGDASTIVGFSNNSASNNEAFRGTTSGITGLGDLAGGSFSSQALAVSADGSVVVGYGNSATGTEAFRWSAGVMIGLGDLPGGSANSIAHGISADGSVIVGQGQNSSFFNEAFRWTHTDGMTGLGFLPGGNSSTAYGISADGQTIVGSGLSTGALEMAFRWTAATGLGPLGDLPGGQVRSLARAVSADGSVIVGQSTSDRGREAFRWTAATGMQPLGDLPGGLFESEALAVSADGSVIVGSASTGTSTEGFIWDAVHGMRSLAALLNAAGISTSASLTTATGISADGRFITGGGWVLDLAAPPPPAATVALLWTEDLPQPGPGQASSVLRIAYENGANRLDVASHIGSTTGGFNGVEYANGQILVPNQGIGGGGTRTHHPDFSPILVTNVFAYDLDARPGELWSTTGNGQSITRSQPSASPVINGGLHDYTFTPLATTQAGRFTFAIQTVGSTVYFSSPTLNPIGIYKMNSDGTGITAVLTGTDAPVVYDFEVVGNVIYFGDIASASIKRVNTDGSGLAILVADAPFAYGIDVTDAAIYWAELLSGTIRRSDLTGANATDLIAGLSSPRGIVAAPLSLLPDVDSLENYLAAAGVPTNLRGPNEDADKDGLANLLEYALDLNPNGTTGGSYGGSLPTVANTAGQCQLTYRRIRSDLTYQVEFSPNLQPGSWTTTGVLQGSAAPDGTTTARIPSQPPAGFMRLAVSPTPP